MPVYAFEVEETYKKVIYVNAPDEEQAEEDLDWAFAIGELDLSRDDDAGYARTVERRDIKPTEHEEIFERKDE